MLPKAKRLTKADFSKRILKSRPFLFGSIKIIAGEAKVAVVISKKVSPKAVERNKLRRRIYNIARGCIAEGRIKNSLIIYPNKKALEASFPELKNEIEKLF